MADAAAAPIIFPGGVYLATTYKYPSDPYAAPYPTWVLDFHTNCVKWPADILLSTGPADGQYIDFSPYHAVFAAAMLEGQGIFARFSP